MSLPPAWEQAYPELKRIARARLYASGRAAGLNTTALVHESFIKLAGGELQFPSHGHFYAYAARVMHSVIVDSLRQSQAQRRGGEASLLPLDTAIEAGLAAPEPEGLQVHAALAQLAALEPRLAQVVEMRYFGGFSEAEIGEALGLNERTVRRDWDKARALLRTLL